MAEIDLPQAEANSLIALEKHRADEDEYVFPSPGKRITIPLTSVDKREAFLLDINRAQVKLTKATYQNRARQAVILMRLDLTGHLTETQMEKKCRVPIFMSTAKDLGTNGLFQLPRPFMAMLRTCTALF
jgi:hypothetical protein